MCGTESIVYVDITMFGELTSELSNLFLRGFDLLAIDGTFTFLSSVESKILKKDDLTVFGFSSDLGGSIADAILNESDVFTNELGDFTNYRLQGEFVVLLSIWATQVRHENNRLGTVVEQVLD